MPRCWRSCLSVRCSQGTAWRPTFPSGGTVTFVLTCTVTATGEPEALPAGPLARVQA